MARSSQKWTRERQREYMKKYRPLHREKMKTYQREWYKANQARIRARKLQYRKDNPEAHALYERRHTLKSKYGITVDDYNRMVETQNGLCFICSRPPGKIGLVVDHDHVTNTVRKLLCANCNLTLGHAFDSPEILRKCADYLEQFLRTVEKVKGV